MEESFLLLVYVSHSHPSRGRSRLACSPSSPVQPLRRSSTGRGEDSNQGINVTDHTVHGTMYVHQCHDLLCFHI